MHRRYSKYFIFWFESKLVLNLGFNFMAYFVKSYGKDNNKIYEKHQFISSKIMKALNDGTIQFSLGHYFDSLYIYEFS